MTARRRPGLGLAALALLHGAAAADGAAPAAGPPLVPQVVPQVALELTRARLVAVERLADGSEFNRDEGAIMERRLHLSWPVAAGFGGRLEAAHSDAGLVYTGFSSLGLPLLSRTSWRHEQFDLLVLRHGPPGPGLRWQWGLGLGQSTSLRAVAATDASLPLTERLRRQEALADLGLAWQPPGLAAGTLALQAHARWRRPLSQRLQAEAPGGLDAVQLRPDAGTAWRARLGVEGALPSWPGWPGWRLGLALHRERVRVGASAAMPARRDGLPVGTVRFPGSTARLRGTTLTLTAHF